jgi:hypothetical protein
MQRIWNVLVISAAMAVAAPSLAHADGYLSPFTRANFGNSSGNGRVNFGMDAGWMGAGILGAEADFGRAPGFFGTQGIGSNAVTNLMGNVILGVPAGGQHGVGLRPYATAGVGLLRSRIDASASSAADTRNQAGVSAGAGVMAYFSDHIGLRGDVRYLRTVTDTSSSGNASVAFGAFHFWRAAVGIVIRP